MKIFLDDEREAPIGWIRAYTVNETIDYLKTKQVTDISFDNDLGSLDSEEEGYRALDWLEEQVFTDHSFPVPIVTVHSANASRIGYMKMVIRKLEQIRQQQIYGE